MQELEYPFDAGYLLGNKRKLKKALLQSTDHFIEKKIAILGGSTTSEIKNMVELFLLNHGIKPFFYESEYHQYYEDAVFGNRTLTDFNPDIIYVCTSIRNIVAFPHLTDSDGVIEEMLHSEFQKYEQIWISLADRYHCPVIQNNFEYPYYRLMGNKEVSDVHGRVNYVTRLNGMFSEYASCHRDFYICDINYIAADYGLGKWSDPFYWHMYKYAVSVPAIPYLAFNVANIIKSVFGQNKKGLVLDLDNTLWGGVIGDDGVDKIKIGPEDAGGSVYTEFQEYLKNLKDLGVLLSIDSKNQEENALAGLNHTQSVLHPDDFVVIKANWEAKDKNFREIASTIGIMPDSLVFIDDNPAERHLIRNQIKDVSAPEIGKSHQYIQNIDHNGYFETTIISADDQKRNEMYKQNMEREKARTSFADYGEYLLSLKMTAEIKEFDAESIARIAQLTNKSNQFNLTTRRYSEPEIDEIRRNDEYITLYGKLRDCFGDNGIVSVIIGRVKGAICYIDLWIMSCRVLKRDMECAMMDKLVCSCKKKDIHAIIGAYYPTEKNHMVADFYKSQGFTKTEEDDAGNTKWILEVNDNYRNHNQYISVEE